MPSAQQPPCHPGTGFNASAQAHRVALVAARRARVKVCAAEGIAALREVAGLLAAVWGRTEEGVPINSEIMRSLIHAGGAVTMAQGDDGAPMGAAVLSVAAPAGSAYSIIAATAPGQQDRGVGRAVKLAQRAWALDHGYRTILWTFDPLVSRNARFNLAKLGAVATQYEPSFYGLMNDAINAVDDSDRLVAAWALDSRRVVAASEGTGADPVGPAPHARMLRIAPDGQPMVVRDASGLWCRVPVDIVALRARRSTQAREWRTAVRDALRPALLGGNVASHMTRNGWYQLTDEEDNA